MQITFSVDEVRKVNKILISIIARYASPSAQVPESQGVVTESKSKLSSGNTGPQLFSRLVSQVNLS